MWGSGTSATTIFTVPTKHRLHLTHAYVGGSAVSTLTVSKAEFDPNIAVTTVVGCAANTTATLSGLDIRVLGGETVALTGTPTEGGFDGWLEPNSNPD